MLYCRKCGAKLEEDAKFCRVCGAPIEASENAAAETLHVKRKKRPSYIIPVAVLIVVLLVSFFVTAVAFVPFKPVNFNQTEVAQATPNVNAINLDFSANAADVNIIPTNLPNQLAKLDVTAKGSTGLFDSDSQPVKVNFSTETSGNTITINSSVTRTETWPVSFNLKVTCNIYVDYSEALNINAQTLVGKITMNPQVPVVLQGLNLRSTTGSVETNLTDATFQTSAIFVSTTTGSTELTWNNAQVSGNLAVNLATTTGSVTANIAHNSILAGNVSLDAMTTTGNVNVNMNISGDIGGQLTSHTSTGSVSVEASNFEGNKSPIYSSNYPATNNFLVNSETTTGSVHITAIYQNQSSTASIQEKIRDDAMAYIKAYHPEAAQFISNFMWTGGRQTPEGLVGAETYSYVSQGWNVTIHYPVVLNPIYTVNATYTSESISIAWEGTFQNGVITEKSYTSTAQLTTQEQARNDVMSYIKTNHEETATFMQYLNWTGGRVNTGLVGAEKYVYTTLKPMPGSAGWTVTISYPVVPNPVYTVTANYTQTGVLSPYKIIWEGTWQNGTVYETSYSANVPITQEQIRDSVMNYIKINHNETAQFMQELNWTGGRVTPPAGFVGSDKYIYISGGWNVTMICPVVLNPIYSISANYTAQGTGIPSRVLWEGTWQNNTIKENSFSFAQ